VSKACSKCGEVQPLSAYCRDARRADGRQARCKECKRSARDYQAEAEPRREYQRKWRAEWRRDNPELAREHWRKYESTKHDYLTQWRKTQDA
jgi:hypothetical protein